MLDFCPPLRSLVYVSCCSLPLVTLSENICRVFTVPRAYRNLFYNYSPSGGPLTAFLSFFTPHPSLSPPQCFSFFRNWLSSFFNFGKDSLSLCSRWYFHWLNVDLAWAPVFTWPIPAQEDKPLTRLPATSLFPSLSPDCRFKKKGGPNWWCVAPTGSNVAHCFIVVAGVFVLSNCLH